ncbi:MAG: hypothetical protein COX39_00165 [Candidatus Nealsonbacteria bacterium CG23_combo_of_CG06-09_8_20_14_all_40_13]|uniref:DUF1461 domain-containing protein n=1 Tax=Candidatus Nealsonbacteria bacterium CG23_combo_of_CG06-09_8_20_14_all_40_13 TaxID=1974724 RepID=A0A2G9YRS8_9BACT|nr:MAG: hypothetical protein COX39_00165 [Candidatus Nealsonbacteria bacterium CG23_combo_of_CG06-09_8_20_14_all_40_13]
MKGFLSALLSFIFIVLFIPFMDFINYQKTILYPNFYKKIFNEIYLYNKLSDNLPDLIANSTKEGRPQNNKTAKQVLKSTLQPADIQVIVEPLLAAIPKILKGQNPQLQISLLPIKEKLGLQNSNTNDMLAIPDQIDLKNYIEQNKSTQQAIKYYNIYRVLLVALPILLLLILFGIYMLARSSPRLAVLRIARTIFTAGVCLLIYALFLRYILANAAIFQNLFSQIKANPLITNALIPAISAMVKDYASPLIFRSYFVIGAGFILHIIGFVLPKTRPQPTITASTEKT